VTGSLVYDARDTIARFAVEHGYDYILYADSDMVFDADDLKKLLAHDVGICSGLYVTRDGRNQNVVYKNIITRRRFPYRQPKLIPDNETSGFASVAACGFGFTLIKVSVVKCMLKYFKSLFEPFKGVGEDIAFCIRARRCGFKTFVDRDVKLGHVGEVVYGERDCN
jgi:GT2 family glycosyltransferase